MKINKKKSWQKINKYCTKICNLTNRDPTAKKQAETTRNLRLQNIRRTLSGKFSEQTLSNMENIDEAVVNKELVISLVSKILRDNKAGDTIRMEIYKMEYLIAQTFLYYYLLFLELIESFSIISFHFISFLFYFCCYFVIYLFIFVCLFFFYL